MMEPSDIRAGLALGVGGLLCLCAWVWQDAAGRKVRFPAAWSLIVLLTAGIGAVAYLAATRKSEQKAFWRGVAVWAAWTVLLGVGGTGIANLAARNREASTQVSRLAVGAPGPEVPAPSMGDFDLAFPQGASQPSPSPSGSR